MPQFDALAAELKAQSAFLAAREPVYARTLALLEMALAGQFGAALGAAWADRDFHAAYARPLLLLAALRHDALCEGPAHPLQAALARQPPDPEAVTSGALAAAIASTRERFWQSLRERSVQTNETTRAVAWLWPAHLLHVGGRRERLAVVDLGTSAGLNLTADALPAHWVDEAGRPLPVSPRPPVAIRLGLDIAPLDVRKPDDAMWLRACVWPSDAARLARLEQALEAFVAAGGRSDEPRLEWCALTDAPVRLDSLPHDNFVLCVQTIVRDYLEPDARRRYEAGLRDFLRRRPGRALLAELEQDLGSEQPSERFAALKVCLAHPAGQWHELTLARTHPHPQRLFVAADAVELFLAANRIGSRQ